MSLNVGVKLNHFAFWQLSKSGLQMSDNERTVHGERNEAH